MSEGDKIGFAAKARRRVIQAGAAAAIGMNTGCPLDDRLMQPPAPQITAQPVFSSDMLSREVIDGLREIAKGVAEGKKFDKLVSQRTLQFALKAYQEAAPLVKEQMLANGFLHIHDAAKGQVETAAVFIDFSNKALVAAKGIKTPSDKDLPIYDMTKVSRAGVVVEKDKIHKAQEESSYMQIAYRLRDKNMNIAMTTIQKTIIQTGDIRKLNNIQLALLNDDDAARVRFNVSDKLFPLVALGRDVVLKRFDTADQRLGVNIRWKQDERVYEAKRFNANTEYWEAAGVVNPFAAALANKVTTQQLR